MLELAIIFQIVSDGFKGLLSFLNLLSTLINAKCKIPNFVEHLSVIFVNVTTELF